MSIRYTLRRVKESDLLPEINAGADPNYENLKRGELCVTDTGKVYVRRQDDVLEEFTHLAALYAEDLLQQVTNGLEQLSALQLQVEELSGGASEAIQDVLSQIAFMHDDVQEDLSTVEGYVTDAQSAKDDAQSAKDDAVTAKEAAEGAKGDAEDSAELAEKWATYMTDTVDGNEYSAKYYATQLANASNYVDQQVTVIGEFAASAQQAADTVQSVTNIYEISNQEIDTVVEGGE